MRKKLLAAWDNYWFAPRKWDKENLGLFRICFYLLCIIIFFLAYNENTLYADEFFYQPVFFYKIFNSVHQMPEAFIVAKVFFYLSCFFSMIGLFTFIMTKVAFVSAFFLFAPFQNYGSYQHLGSTIIISMLIVSLSACADSFSVDEYLAKKRNPEFAGPENYYVWPLALLKFVWCFIFFTAGLLKILTNDLDWFRYNMLGIFIERFNPLYNFNMSNALSVWLRETITAHYWFGRVATVLAVMLELSMPLILFSKRLKAPLLFLGFLFLFCVMILMGHHFYYTLLPYILGIFFLEINVVEKLKQAKKLA